jgi:hypothetical protein
MMELGRFFIFGGAAVFGILWVVLMVLYVVTAIYSYFVPYSGKR